MLNQLIPRKCLPVFPPLPGMGLCQQPGGAEPCSQQECPWCSPPQGHPELHFLVAPWWESVPKAGQGIGASSGAGLHAEDPQQGMEAVPLPGLGWDQCWGEGLAGRAVAAGPGTQRVLLLLPDPIIPSPILAQGLGARQGKLRQCCPRSPHPVGRWAVPRCGSWHVAGTAQGVLQALPHSWLHIWNSPLHPACL